MSYLREALQYQVGWPTYIFVTKIYVILNLAQFFSYRDITFVIFLPGIQTGSSL